MVKGPKHGSKLNENTFPIFVDTSEGNSDVKSLPELYAVS